MSLSPRIPNKSHANGTDCLCGQGSRMVVAVDGNASLTNAERRKSNMLQEFLTNNCFYRAFLSESLSIEGLRQQVPILSQKQLRDMILGAHQAIAAGKKMYDALHLHFSGKKAH